MTRSLTYWFHRILYNLGNLPRFDAVKRWRFMPARRGASTVAAWVQVPVNFKLR